MALSKRQRDVLLALKEVYISGNPRVVEAEIVHNGQRGIMPEIDIDGYDGNQEEASIFAIKALKAMYDNGGDTSKIEKLLGIEDDLPEELVKELDKFKDTPMEEPDYPIDGGMYDMEEFITKRLDMSGYDQKTTAQFVNAVVLKIGSYYDKDHNLKRSPIMKHGWKLTPQEGKKIIGLIDLILDIKKIEEARTKVLKVVSKRIPLKGVSDWEKTLLYFHISDMVMGRAKSYAGVFK